MTEGVVFYRQERLSMEQLKKAVQYLMDAESALLGLEQGGIPAGGGQTWAGHDCALKWRELAAMRHDISTLRHDWGLLLEEARLDGVRLDCAHCDGTGSARKLK